MFVGSSARLRSRPRDSSLAEKKKKKKKHHHRNSPAILFSIWCMQDPLCSISLLPLQLCLSFAPFPLHPLLFIVQLLITRNTSVCSCLNSLLHSALGQGVLSRILANRSTCWPTTPTNIPRPSAFEAASLRSFVFPQPPLARRVSSASASLVSETLDPAISSSSSLRVRRPGLFCPCISRQIRPRGRFSQRRFCLGTIPKKRQGQAVGTGEQPQSDQRRSRQNRCSWSAFCHPFLGTKVYTIGPFFLFLQRCSLASHFSFIFRP